MTAITPKSELSANYPAGVSQRDITALCPDRPADKDYDTHCCFLCSREFVQDQWTRRFFWDEDVDLLGMAHLRKWFTYSLDAFQTQMGWCCGADCWNDNVALNEDESIPARPTLQLVKGGRA